MIKNQIQFHHINQQQDINKMIKLNIGCGPNVFPYDGWINYDHADLKSYFDYIKSTNRLMEMPLHQQKLSSYLKGGGSIDYRHKNITEPFTEHQNNSVDVIYLGQVIEHLNPIYEMPNLLKECYRILKPSGVLRITTPDLDLLIKAYLNNDMDKFSVEQPDFYKNADPSSQLAYIMYGACGPDCKFTNYEGHMFLFTKKSMTTSLKQAGFNSIFFSYETGKSNSPILEKEAVDAGMSHSFIAEAVK
jgi:predicted SAM-dependent methyltransferase